MLLVGGVFVGGGAVGSVVGVDGLVDLVG